MICHSAENNIGSKQSVKCKRPVEIYVFIDPLCAEAWALEPILKKLYLHYNDVFTIRHVITSKLQRLNLAKGNKPSNIAAVWEHTASRSGMSCDGDLWFEDPIATPYAASIGIKAAELQGKHAGVRFLRKMQETMFLKKQNVSKEEVLIKIAEKAGLDIHEFQKDLHSEGAVKAFQCDLKISGEMEIDRSPSLVFFNNENIDSEGLKVTGQYEYEVYEQILKDIFQRDIQPKPLPKIEQFLSHYSFVAAKEIEVVYNMTCKEVETMMRKLALKGEVKCVPVKYGTFWRYIGKKNT
ncbi:ClpXP adapter SpxH family protein [Bacillus solimangrovi]|uniref:ClpXP adapter SpxH family protein n=1 Tax=Bacillus solimangrovi TaxID=1305675 RepID=UPI000AE2F80B|nr:ClpXP adapter SpxH family protein [Bacillus solimangrovi]